MAEVTIVLGNTYPEKVKEYYGDGGAFSAKISYVHQSEEWPSWVIIQTEHG